MDKMDKIEMNKVGDIFDLENGGVHTISFYTMDDPDRAKKVFDKMVKLYELYGRLEEAKELIASMLNIRTEGDIFED